MMSDEFVSVDETLYFLKQSKWRSRIAFNVIIFEAYVLNIFALSLTATVNRVNPRLQQDEVF